MAYPSSPGVKYALYHPAGLGFTRVVLRVQEDLNIHVKLVFIDCITKFSHVRPDQWVTQENLHADNLHQKFGFLFPDRFVSLQFAMVVGEPVLRLISSSEYFLCYLSAR